MFIYFRDSLVNQLVIWSLTLHAGVKVRVYCPVGKSDKGEYALHVAVKTLDLFTR